jgi:hypothetical protein
VGAPPAAALARAITRLANALPVSSRATTMADRAAVSESIERDSARRSRSASTSQDLPVRLRGISISTTPSSNRERTS